MRWSQQIQTLLPAIQGPGFQSGQTEDASDATEARPVQPSPEAIAVQLELPEAEII